MSRKIPEANVQQAWMLASVRAAKAEHILCVGCFEDSAFETLLAERKALSPDRVDETTLAGIDPAIPGSCSLHGFVSNPFRMEPKLFDCIFATSVLEHVDDDKEFIRDICMLLKPDGVALLTVDFKADYKPGDPLPATSKRFYTPADYDRLGKVMEQQACYWLDHPQLQGEPDFSYQGHHYSFATMVIKHL
jgi:SAM-dependent methyltransferase